MHAVLGIDAAWTAAQPSGVALAVERGNGWRMIGAVASYQRFHALADERQPAKPRPMGHRQTRWRCFSPLRFFAAARSTSSLLICRWLYRRLSGVALPMMRSLGPMARVNAEPIRQARFGPAASVTP
jgi:hypothetical protein